MKTLVVECKFVIEIPWDHEPQYSTDEHIRFVIEENSCPGTGSVGGELDDLIQVADENEICWACALGGENKLLAIEDREPRNYAKEIKFRERKTPMDCPACGISGLEVVRKNASIETRSFQCRKCGSNYSSMDIG